MTFLIWCWQRTKPHKVKKYMLWIIASSTFFENIFRSGLTLVSSWDCLCHEDSKQTKMKFIFNPVTWIELRCNLYHGMSDSPMFAEPSKAIISVGSSVSLSRDTDGDTWHPYCNRWEFWSRNTDVSVLLSIISFENEKNFANSHHQTCMKVREEQLLIWYYKTSNVELSEQIILWCSINCYQLQRHGLYGNIFAWFFFAKFRFVFA